LRPYLSAAGIAASTLAFAILAARIDAGHPPSWDGSLLRLVAHHRLPHSIGAALGILVDVGRAYRELVVAALVLLALALARRPGPALAGVLVVGLSLASVVLLKPRFDRPPLIPYHQGYFPSTHAATSAAVAAAACFMAWPTRLRRVVVPLSIAAAALYGFALVYERAHFPSDVVGGWCVAAFWASVGVAFRAEAWPNSGWARWHSRLPRPGRQRSSP
jgi:undecaprenyl-diphosphatase